MCGLFGVAGDLNYKDKDVFNQLMIVSGFRGLDSTGVAAINEKSGEPTILKQVGHGLDLQEHPKYDMIARIYNNCALIGHARKATQGGISRLTAHPFESEHITMTHNGTLDNWRNAWRDGGIEGNYQSDSQKLTDAVAYMGIKDAVEGVKGAMALVWWDKERKTLNFYRNDQRTLWYALSANGKTIYWASEWRMLMLVLDRVGIDLWVHEKEKTRFHAVPTDLHIEWDLMGNGNSSAVQWRQEVTYEGGKNVKSYVPFAGNYRGAYNQSQQGVDETWTMNDKGVWVKTYPNPFGLTIEEGDADLNDPLPLLTGPNDKEAQEKPSGTPPVITKKASESKNTPSSTTDSQKKDSKKSPSSPKPTLSLVQNNKRNSSEKSESSTDETIEGFAGELLDEKTYLEQTHGKCAYCDTDISFKEAQNGHIVDWMSRDSFICTHCTGQRASAGA